MHKHVSVTKLLSQLAFVHNVILSPIWGSSGTLLAGSSISIAFFLRRENPQPNLGGAGQLSAHTCIHSIGRIVLCSKLYPCDL